ncbi:MAG: tRNA-guanine transglycosylase DpdA [Myxococcota bacterium]|nr:tRNA-guanine transglycosylase DpdA [Myxococcota bacterium]
MKIIIVTSCTGEKAIKHDKALTLADFKKGTEGIAIAENAIKEHLLPSEEMYTGQQHVRLMRGVKAFRKKFPKPDSTSSIELHILSAGYGIISGQQKIAPYETTFTGMKAKELRQWADQLGIPADIRTLLSQPYNLALILLGDSYLKACAFDDHLKLGGPTLVFCGSRMAKKMPNTKDLKVVSLANPEAKRFGCSLIGLKGELAGRYLKSIAENPKALQAIWRAKKMLDKLEFKGGTPKKKKAVPNPAVNRVIQLPTDWNTRSKNRRLRYFIPEWDDLVDNDYDFEHDIHSGGSGTWANEVYAHQMYPEPNYDGLLISKVVAEKSKSKREKINELGVHRFLRVPDSFPVMGDCGAFGYINEDIPPYSTTEILDYYTRLGFDFGVSIDHLIVKATAQKKRERYQLTIQNAEDFLKEHNAQDLPWTPMGAVQGWDPKSYAEAARQCVAMGYQYIALGGLTRTQTKGVLELLDEVKKVVPKSVGLHLFGLARIDAMKQFADLGVTSVDSASLLRRAWMGTGQNYVTMQGIFYTAIRVPEAGKSFRAKRMVEEGRASASEVKQLDKACMQALQDFDNDRVSVQYVLDILREYDHLITPNRTDTTELLRHTLEDRPWKKCGCPICKKDGIQVVIFRGNNRNRRRGFHNTYVFYKLLEKALNGEPISFKRKETLSQLTLPSILTGTDNAI